MENNKIGKWCVVEIRKIAIFKNAETHWHNNKCYDKKACPARFNGKDYAGIWNIPLFSGKMQKIRPEI